MQTYQHQRDAILIHSNPSDTSDKVNFWPIPMYHINNDDLLLIHYIFQLNNNSPYAVGRSDANSWLIFA